MSDEHDETRLIPPTPAPNDPTMLTPPVSGSRASSPDAATIAIPPSHGSSGVSRPVSASAAARSAAAPPAGMKRVGDYDLESEIARGGMGVVYRARQLSLNRPVAFKMILAGQFASDADVERFQVEAEAAAGLDHPNIVPIYEVGAFEGNHFFTMKLIDGRSMAHEMPRLVTAPRDGVRMLVKVCRAIHFAHQHSILHRDLKPANILLDAQGEPHVTDFGLAKRTGPGDSQLTQTGTIVGTPSYMAPEQAAPSKIPLTTAADVYSLGAMLYEVLTGRPPFKGDSPLDTLMLVLNKEPDRPRTLNPSADRDLETVALKCLEKDPDRRYGSAEALAEDLDRWLAGEPILARPIGSAERVMKWAKRRPAIAALAVAMAVVTVLGVAGVVWQWREAVYQRGQTAEAMIQVAQEAKAAELARDQEAAQRKAAEDAQARETVQRQAADDQKAVAVDALGEAQRNLYFNNIDLADREWAANNIGHLDALLAASPAPLRNWEWNYLHRLAHMETGAFGDPGSAITALAMSADGRRATAIAEDLTVSLWDLGTLRRVSRVRLDGIPGSEMGATAISADGSIVAATIRRFENGTMIEDSRAWDTATGRTLWTMPPVVFMGYTSFAINRDGTRVVTAAIETPTAPSPTPTPTPNGAPPTPEAALQVLAQAMGKIGTRLNARNVLTGADLPSAGLVPGRVSRVTLSPDGSRLLVASQTLAPNATFMAVGTPIDLKLLDSATGRELATLNHSADTTPVFSADGGSIVGSTSKSVRFWTAAGGDERWSWTAKAPGVLAFSPSGRLVAVALADRSIHVLDAATGEERDRFTGNTAPVVALSFAGAETSLVSADDGGHLRLFTWSETPEAVIAPGTAEPAVAAAVAPGNRRVIAVDAMGGLKGWDLDSGWLVFGPAKPDPVPVRLPLPVTVAGPAASRPWFSADGRRVAVLTPAFFDLGDGRGQLRTDVHLVDTTTGRELIRFRQAGAGQESSDRALLARALQSAVVTSPASSTSLDATGAHLAVTTMLVQLGLTAPGGSVGPSSTPTKVTVVGCRVDVWTMQREQPVASITLKDTIVVSSEFSPDGSRLALLAGGYSDNGPIAAKYRVYDVATQKLVATFEADKETAPMAFSRDGSRLAAETAHRTVTIWNLDHSGRPVVLPEHGSAVTRLVFSPDGTRLASLSGQGVTLFDARSGNQLLALHESSGPYRVRELIFPGKLTSGVTTLGFSDDGRQIVETVVSPDPKGIKVQFRTWDGSPRESQKLEVRSQK